jgi:hypothetical protein
MKRLLIALICGLSLVSVAGRRWIPPQPAGGGGGPVTIGPISVAAAADDGVVYGNSRDSAGWGSDGAGNFGEYGSDPSYVYVRFVLPSAIPPGATITAATVTLYGTSPRVETWTDGTDDAVIEVQNSANASAPSAGSERPTTGGGSGSVLSPIAWTDLTWTNGGTNTSPSLVTPIQSLVTTNGGLASSAGIVIWLSGNLANPGDHSVDVNLYEYSGGTPATLTITYTP